MVSHAQFRSQNRQPNEEVKHLSLEDLDAMIGEESAGVPTIPVAPLSKAGPPDEQRDDHGRWAAEDLVVASKRHPSGWSATAHTPTGELVTNTSPVFLSSAAAKSSVRGQAKRVLRDPEHADKFKKAAHDVSTEARVGSGQTGGGEWTAGGSNPSSKPSTSKPTNAKPTPANAAVPLLHLPLPIATLRGDAKVKGVSVDNFLQGADGKPLRFSAADITKLAFIRDGVAAPKTALKSAADFDRTVREDLVPQLIGKENVATNGVDSFAKHFRDIAKSAVARYTADPALEDRDKFYSQWFYVTHELSQQVHIDQDRVAAAMANLSAGTTASQNMRYGTDLAHMVADNIAIPAEPEGNDAGPHGENLAAHLEREKVINFLKVARDENAPKGKAGAAAAKKLQYSIDLIESGKANSINDLPSIAAARFAHLYRKAYGPQGDIPLDPRMGAEYGAGLKTSKGAGFGVSKGYLNYEKAINVLRGYSVEEGSDGEPVHVPFTPSDAVQQVKTRNFLNNIIDPDDAQGYDSTTVDFHAMNSASFSIGGADGEGSSQWNSGATVAGVQLGVRAHVADTIRAQVPYLRKALGDPHLSSARAQEILWAEWQRGLDRGEPHWNPNPQAPVWKSFTGKAFPLLDLREPPSERTKNVREKQKQQKKADKR